MLRKKRIISIFIAAALTITSAVGFSGCADNTQQGGSDKGLDAAGSSISVDKPSSESEQGVTYPLSMTYANMEYIETGDETVDKLVEGVQGEVVLDKENEEMAVMQAIDKLRTVPQDIPDANATTLITSDVQVNKVVIDKGVCNIDLEGTNIYNLDLYTETYFIYQIVDTILHSFGDINSVMFTVDGETVESLNYMDMSAPFTQSSVDGFITSNAAE